mmetsp:Transcript_12867/g.40421  ORF Transcript_12867/g.40421 Transcript_12867/m.40421 type:complete len:500 (-) Transcript_12867:45-1544(-)
MSVAELKSRAEELGLEIPPYVVEKSELLALVEKAERQRAKLDPLQPSGASPSKSVAELKSRLTELGLEIPSNILEKRELVVLVEEAERQHAKAGCSAAGLAESVPAPWCRRESRSKPGRFYYYNRATGKTTWHLPSIAEKEPAKPPLAEVGEKQEELGEPCEPDYREEAFSDGLQDQCDEERMVVRRPSVLFCSQGPHGVKSITVPADIVGELTRTMSQTISAAGAIKGKEFTWIRGDILGRGSLGTVFEALDQKTGQVIAVKEVPINAADEDDKKFVSSLENEVCILQHLKHPHIVSYLGHDKIDGCLYLYLECMPGGTMTQALQLYGAFDESLIGDYSKQLLDGLQYLHTRSPPVVHRDIKGSNILIGLDCRAKLADFGCSKRAQETMTHTMRGSIPWMAPEVIAHARYGRAADIWSFGCVAIEMGTARVPWGRFDNQMAAMLKIGMSKETPQLPEGISAVSEDFIRRCVVRDQTCRPTATELLEHEFVRDILPCSE